MISVTYDKCELKFMINVIDPCAGKEKNSSFKTYSRVIRFIGKIYMVSCSS